MGTYNSAVITTAGQSLLARAIADNLPFYFTSAKTTEYVVPTGTSAASLTELPNIKQSEEITSATVSGGNQVATSVRFDNTEITLNYSINTIGVYARVGTDTEETLLAVITAITADVMPSYSAANPVSYVYSINLAISNASNINIVVSPTGTVNVAEFTELKERVDEIIDSGSGLSTDAKMALLNCFKHVAWIDEHGQTYYDTLHDALFPTAVSISATFTPGSHVFYDTDSLDALRPYLIVRATMPDGSVEIVTNYVLTGSMAAGTNTITVRYQGITDTFEVTTQANPAYIMAVYTQPQTTIYTDDDLDDLKDDLVVTYYDRQGQSTVLSDNDYTLSGTLVDGTSTVTVTYGAYTTTFTVTDVIDFYNHWNWDYPTLLEKVSAALVDPGSSVNPSNEIQINPYYGNNFRVFVLSKGKHPYVDRSTTLPTTYYPIPVPPTATNVTVSVTPNNYYIRTSIAQYHDAEDNYTQIGSSSWGEGSTSRALSAGANKFASVCVKANSAGDATFPTEPTSVTVTFS